MSENKEIKKPDYEEPTVLDTEDLEDVAGGSICITGGGCNSNKELAAE
jgi:hypothetical protein